MSGMNARVSVDSAETVNWWFWWRWWSSVYTKPNTIYGPVVFVDTICFLNKWALL
jgi:hypothetical protein